MYSIYTDTLNTLSSAFEENLSHQKDISTETIAQAVELLMGIILNMSFDKEYKKALGNACIEASSLIDPELCIDKATAVKAFQSNLDNKLAYLFRSPRPE